MVTKDNIEYFYDEIEALSVIFVSKNRGSIVFRDNNFTSNIGLYGGAITIDSPNWQAN